jgi:hypothetical protein
MANPTDQYGINQVNPTKIIDFRELGVTGLRRYSGFVLEDFLQQLLQWRGIDIYREMSWNDPDVGAALGAIRMMCRRVPWRVQPATMQTYDIEAAKFIETCMDDMNRSWLDVVDEILFHVLPFGHAPEEVTYKRRCGPLQPNPSMRSKYSDGRVGWRKMEIRHPDTIWKWEFDEFGGIQGLHQMAPPRFQRVFIPIRKLLLFRTTTQKNNPEGFSVLRNAYRPWYMKKNLENIEAIGAERDMAGLPVALVPPDIMSPSADANQQALYANIKQLVINIRQDEQMGVVFPKQYDSNGKEMYELKLLSTAGAKQFDCDKIIQRYRQSIMMTVFADFMLLGHGGGSGNRSIVEKRADLFCIAVGAFLDAIQDVFNKYAIPRLFEMNPDLQVSDYPKLQHGDLQTQDLDVLGSYMLRLSQTGMPMWPNIELQKFLMEAAKGPVPIDPMKVASELEIQPKKPPEEGDTMVVYPDEPVQSSTLKIPTTDIPVPGVPPMPGQNGTMFAPYPAPEP